MNNEETILDNSMLNENQSEQTRFDSNESATSNESAIAEKKQKNATAEKIAYAAGGAVLGAGATFAGQSMAAPKTEKPVVKDEDKNEPETADDKAEGKADADASNAADDKADAASSKETDANAHAPQHDEHDGVTVEVNGAKVHVDGDASVKVSQDGTIEINPEESEPHYTNIVNDAHHSKPVHEAINQHVHPSPAEEDAILVTDDGVKVAHVDDNMSFAQAFAEAREQVGPGGVFVWHGKAYGTFYEDEWNHMTPAERSAYQASIDYEDILPDHHHSHSHHDYAQHDSHSSHHSHASNDTHHSHESHDAHHSHASYESHASHDSHIHEVNDVTEDVEVSIIGYGETDINEDGISEYSVAVDVDGQEVLFVDIDDDYQAEVAISDFDGDGAISENDVIDVSGQNIMLPTEDQIDTYLDSSDSYTVQNDDLPDYMNDADPGMYMA